MSIRIPIGPAAALFEEGAADFFGPAPAERVVHFADTPVEFVNSQDQIRLSVTGNTEARPKLVPGRSYH
jgi:hypothetical protein